MHWESFLVTIICIPWVAMLIREKVSCGALGTLISRYDIETFAKYCPFVSGIHRSSMDSPHKGTVRLWLDKPKRILTFVSGILEARRCWTLLQRPPIIQYQCFILFTRIINIKCGAVITRYIFSKNKNKPTYNRRPITRPWGRDMGCLLWLRNLICVLLPSLHFYK